MKTWWSLPAMVLLTGAAALASGLPRRAELALGRFLGRFLVFYKRRIVEENLALAMPELDSAARRRLADANYAHYGVLFLEYLHFFCPWPGHFRRYAARISRLEGRELWEAASARGKGVIFFSSHVGFWEMSAAAAGLAGIAPTIVTTVLKPAWLHEAITACRASAGVAAAFHPGSMPAVLRALRRGGSVAFMNDQYAPPPMGLPVVFFGRKVDTLSVVAPLARRTGAAVLPVSVVRDADGTNVARIEPEMELGEDPVAGTQAVAAHVEGWVRAHPEQWLWLHRRFKRSTPA